jgi:hypothetical protein
MKKEAMALVIALSITVSMPAVAGPNWDVIHKAEANKAAHKHEAALVLPLDYGPRAITTPWLNKERLGKLVAQIDAQQRVAHAQAKKSHVVVAAHPSHQGLTSRS